MHHLTVQVGGLDHVWVRDTQLMDAGTGEVWNDRAAKATCADLRLCVQSQELSYGHHWTIGLLLMMNIHVPRARSCY